MGDQLLGAIEFGLACLSIWALVWLIRNPRP